MVVLGPASIVVIPFPFSYLSATKLRPAIVLAETGHNDWLLCQITSNPYNRSRCCASYQHRFGQGRFEHGEFFSPNGEYAGQLGPWAQVVEAVGIPPHSTVMKLIFVVYGLAAIVVAAAFALQLSWA